MRKKDLTSTRYSIILFLGEREIKIKKIKFRKYQINKILKRKKQCLRWLVLSLSRVKP